MDRYETFGAALVFVIFVTAILYLVPRFGLRNFKFSRKDTKDAGLNRAQGRRFLSSRRKKPSNRKDRKHGRIRF